MIHIFPLSSRYIPYVRKNKRLDDALNYDARFLVGEVNAVHRYVPDSLRCMCVYGSLIDVGVVVKCRHKEERAHERRERVNDIEHE